MREIADKCRCGGRYVRDNHRRRPRCERCGRAYVKPPAPPADGRPVQYQIPWALAQLIPQEA